MTKHYPYVLVLLAIFGFQLSNAQTFQKISSTNNLSPRNLADLSGTLFFSGFDFRGRELWKSDGTQAGTTFFKELAVGGSSHSDPRNFIRVGNYLYFIAHFGGITYPQIAKTDGTLAGTVQVSNHQNPVFDDPQIGNLTEVNDVLFYTAWDNQGTELYKIIPTGTQLVKDIYPGSSGMPIAYPNGSFPTNLTDVNGALFFGANDGVNGVELWKSDGTDAGTVLIRNINPAGNSDPSSTANVNGTLFFSANDGTNGAELWKSDGTNAGTVLVKDINPGSGSSNIVNTVNVNGIAFFVATNGVNGAELWKSDGTSAGTVMVKDINTSGSSSPSNPVVLNGVLYFSADDGINGVELWRSDGTDAGTNMIRDINPLVGSASPVRLTTIGNRIYFAANNGVNGVELWRSDGTSAGTVLVQDFNPGAASSNVNNITQSGSLMYVVALDNTGFDQLYVTTIPADAPLPLNLLTFSAHLQDKDGILTWKTASEVNTSSFEIERSIDARNFSKVGTRSASGNSFSFNYYSFSDPNITMLSARAVYYKLKMIDQDGSFKYSAVVVLGINSKQAVVVLYPNPANDVITLMISTTQREKILSSIVDATGRVVKTMTFNLQSGSNNIPVSLSDVAAGMYTLVIDGMNGKSQHSFIRQ